MHGRERRLAGVSAAQNNVNGNSKHEQQCIRLEHSTYVGSECITWMRMFADGAKTGKWKRRCTDNVEITYTL